MVKFLSFTALALLGTGALAQTAPVLVAPAPWWVDVAVPVIGTVLTAVIGFAVALFSRWTGVQVSAAARETIHSAAMTGVNIGLDKLKAKIGTVSLTTLSPANRNFVVNEGVQWVLGGGAKDSVETAGASGADIQAVVEGKLAAITNANATVGVTTSSASVPGG